VRRGALKSRATIGRAEGIVMERLDIGAAHAWQYLRWMSLDSTRTLADVAADIVATCTPPTDD
jgi:AmiR/NasT family two-component response regulator